MSLNANVHFKQLPEVNMRRSVHKQPFTHLTTFDFGKLIPFYCIPCLPSSTYQRKWDNITVRMSTPAAPVYDESFLDVFYFYVPFRLVWNHTEHFFARTTENAYVPLTEYLVPGMKPYGIEQNSVGDYFGLPTKVSKKAGESAAIYTTASQLYMRAYALIWNTYFRSEELQDPILIDKSDTDHAYVNIASGYLAGAQYGGALCPVDKYHDYFTSCLLRPLRNNSEVPLLQEFAPVMSLDDPSAWQIAPMTWKNISTGNIVTPGSAANVQAAASNGFTQVGSGVIATPANLYANVSASISDLRNQFLIEEMYIKDNLFGGRYNEILYGHFKSYIPENVAQEPVFIGGSHIRLNVQQVLQNSESSSTPLGYPGAYSLTTHKNRYVFNHHSPEFGCIIGVCCARTKQKYQYCLERFWSQRKRTDFFWPTLERLGNMAVKNKEIYFSGDYNKDNQVFGYQEYGADYKYKVDLITGAFRSNYTQEVEGVETPASLDFYHYAEEESQTPVLSDAWIVQDNAPVERTLLATGKFANELLVYFESETNCILPMKVYATPGTLASSW